MNKFSGVIFNGRLKQEHLVTKSNPVIISQGDNKNEKKKKEMLQTFGLGYFIGVQKEPGICYKEYARI